MTYNRLSAHLPPVSAGLIFGIRGVIAATLAAVVIALTVVVITMAAGGTANAQCRKNYYPCAMNKGGVLDKANPGCCWSPAAGPGNINLQSCPKGFYKCDLNKDGALDPKRPGCCLSDIRLKHDVVKLGTLGNGIGIYRFRYNWSDQAYVGVMAQEVQTIMPEAVRRGADGYLRVNYDKVGVLFQTWEAWGAAKTEDSMAPALH